MTFSRRSFGLRADRGWHCRNHAETMQSVLKLVGHVLQTGRASFPGPGEITGAGKHEAMKATTTTLIVTLKKAKLQQR